MSFENKVVIVTGAGSAVGAATAVLFAKEKANLVLTGKSRTELGSVASFCKTRKLIIEADVSVEADVIDIVQQTVEEFGKIDVLVNNAGAMVYGRISSRNILSAYDEVMATNLRGVIHLTSLCAGHLLKSKGNIVNVSAATRSSGPMSLPYNISKAALNSFSRGVALELGAGGVRVNTVSPGPVMTNFAVKSQYVESSYALKSVREKTILNRLSEAEEVADVIVFLASDRARGITGSDFVVDNGFTLKR